MRLLLTTSSASSGSDAAAPVTASMTLSPCDDQHVGAGDLDAVVHHRLDQCEGSFLASSSVSACAGLNAPAKLIARPSAATVRQTRTLNEFIIFEKNRGGHCPPR